MRNFNAWATGGSAGDIIVCWSEDFKEYGRCCSCWQWSDEKHVLKDKHIRGTALFARKTPVDQVKATYDCLAAARGEGSGSLMIQFGCMLLWGGQGPNRDAYLPCLLRFDWPDSGRLGASCEWAEAFGWE